VNPYSKKANKKAQYVEAIQQTNFYQFRCNCKTIITLIPLWFSHSPTYFRKENSNCTNIKK
jgi:hypothetical protein